MKDLEQQFVDRMLTLYGITVSDDFYHSSKGESDPQGIEAVFRKLFPILAATSMVVMVDNRGPFPRITYHKTK